MIVCLKRVCLLYVLESAPKIASDVGIRKVLSVRQAPRFGSCCEGRKSHLWGFQGDCIKYGDILKLQCNTERLRAVSTISPLKLARLEVVHDQTPILRLRLSHSPNLPLIKASN